MVSVSIPTSAGSALLRHITGGAVTTRDPTADTEALRAPALRISFTSLARRPGVHPHGRGICGQRSETAQENAMRSGPLRARIRRGRRLGEVRSGLIAVWGAWSCRPRVKRCLQWSEA